MQIAAGTSTRNTLIHSRNSNRLEGWRVSLNNEEKGFALPPTGRVPRLVASLVDLNFHRRCSMARSSLSTLDPLTRRGLLPSWLLSLTLHAIILVLAAASLDRFSGRGERGEADTQWRSVGLITRTEAAPSPTDNTNDSQELPTIPETFDAPPLPSTAVDSQQPPVPLAHTNPLGTDLPELIGPGQAKPQFSTASSSTSADLHGPVIPPSQMGGLQRGETSFFNIKASGQKFVYLLDASGSMETDNAITVAKAELMSSLQNLHPDQQFQIIFYNERPHTMVLAGKGRSDLYWATDINRTLARTFIAGIQAELGTEHVAALKAALSLQPDVLYFLTDAEEPVLTGADLDQILRANAAGTRIHCVEFGRGAKLRRESTLERLAMSNHGIHQYRDTARFGR